MPADEQPSPGPILVDFAVSELIQGLGPEGSARLDASRVEYYLEHLDESPPITVYDIHGSLLLVDGHHRLAAAQRLGRSSVTVEIRLGERSDALRFAVENARRQRGLSEQEIREAIARRAQP